MRISYNETARIADNLGRLLNANVSMDRVFATVLRYNRSRRARRALCVVERTVAEGRPFHEGFAACSGAWPRYFIELVRCAEMAGMLYAGFEEGAEHFRKMARVRRSAHMLWMSPAAIIVFGWVVISCAVFWWAGWEQGVTTAVAYLRKAAAWVAVVGACVYVPPLRRVVDNVLLALPAVGVVVRDLALYQFTSCFRYLYLAAVSAPDIVRYAGGAVGNTHLRKRLAECRHVVAEGGMFSDALAPALHWPDDMISRLRVAEESGQLDAMLNAFAEERREAIHTRVTRIRMISDRLVAYSTVFTIVFVIYSLILQYRSVR